MSAKFEPRPRGRRGRPLSVLLLVPDGLLRDLLVHTLRGEGWFPMPASNAEEGRRIVAQVVPDVIVVDADQTSASDLLPASADHARAAPLQVPVLALSAGETAHGAASTGQACLAKPVNPLALIDRLKRLALPPPRPVENELPPQKPPLVLPGLEVDRDAPTLRRRTGDAWQTRDLSPREHRMLLALLQAQPRVMSREDLRQAVWGDEPVTLRSVDQYVKRLRTALAACGLRDLIGTCRGAGYRVEAGVLGDTE